MRLQFIHFRYIFSEAVELRRYNPTRIPFYSIFHSNTGILPWHNCALRIGHDVNSLASKVRLSKNEICIPLAALWPVAWIIENRPPGAPVSLPSMTFIHVDASAAQQKLIASRARDGTTCRSSLSATVFFPCRACPFSRECVCAWDASIILSWTMCRKRFRYRYSTQTAWGRETSLLDVAQVGKFLRLWTDISRICSQFDFTAN